MMNQEQSHLMAQETVTDNMGNLPLFEIILEINSEIFFQETETSVVVTLCL